MKFFKDWAVPGVEVNTPVELSDGETCDAISGHYKIYQLKRGHRYSTDDLLVAWYGSSWCPSARRVLDLGSGVSSVAICAAWRLVGASFTTVEAQSESIALARKSIKHNQLDDRFDLREGDFRDPSIFQQNEKFDLIFGSPPYFALESGIVGDHPQKIACRFETRGDISDYCRIAAERLGHGGVFACVFPIDPPFQADRIAKAAVDAHLTVVRMRPVVLKEGQEALLGLFLMMKAEHLPKNFQTWTEPALCIRTAAGEIHPEYAALKLSIGFRP